MVATHADNPVTWGMAPTRDLCEIPANHGRFA